MTFGPVQQLPSKVRVTLEERVYFWTVKTDPISAAVTSGDHGRFMFADDERSWRQALEELLWWSIIRLA